MPGSSLSALDILQSWGAWGDESRGRPELTRPYQAELPSPLAEDRHRKLSDLQRYITTLSIGVVEELWSEARRGDARLAREEEWVTATVSSRLVHPAVDNIDPHNEGDTSEVLYLTLPHDDVKWFGGYDVVGLRTSTNAVPLIVGVQKLKRTTNQIILKRAYKGAMLPNYKLGATLHVAPFINAKTWSVELREVQGLSTVDPGLLASLLMPEIHSRALLLTPPSAHSRTTSRTST